MYLHAATEETNFVLLNRNGRRCQKGSFAPAEVPLYGELNVGFSQTFANLLLQSLPKDSGVILLNTGVGGSGFYQTNAWTPPNGALVKNSVAAMESLVSDFPSAFRNGTLHFHAMLWHQGEHDAGDNRQGFHVSDFST